MLRCKSGVNLSGSTLRRPPFSLQSVVELVEGVEGAEPFGCLKNCRAAEEQPGILLVEAQLVGESPHHNLHPFLPPSDRSQAPQSPYSASPPLALAGEGAAKWQQPWAWLLELQRELMVAPR